MPFDPAWTERKLITIPAANVAGNVSDFPVYINLADAGSRFFDAVLNGGADIRITTSDGETECPREVVTCDTGTDTGELHFKAPSLSASVDNLFYLYYGNAAASEPAVGDSNGRNAVWSNGYIRVFHLGTGGANATDSSGNGNGTWQDSLPNTVAAKIGNGQNFDGSNDGIDTGRAEGAVWTWQTWFRNDTLSGFDSIIAIDGGNYLLMDTNGANGAFFSHDGLGGGNLGITGLSAATWYALTLVREGNSTTNGYKAYLNGAHTGSGNSGTWSAGNNPTIGRRVDQPGQEFDGIQDEVRFSTVARASAWIATEYDNQNDPTSFCSIGDVAASGRLLGLRRRMALSL